MEWYWQRKTEVLGEKHYTAWVVGEWMGMEHWWNDTDRGNWSTGRETLYSVGGRWMNGYGALVEWYWQGKTEVLGEKPVPRPLYPPQISHGLTKPGPSWQEAVGETPKPWHCFSGSPFTFSHCMHSVVEDGTGLYFWYAVGWGTALQAGSSRVRFPLVSLEFFIVLIVPAALWSWYRLNL